MRPHGLPAGQRGQAYETCSHEIFSLPDDTIIYPAHDYKGHRCSTVGEEKALNPRLGSGKTKDEFIEIMANLNLPYPKKIDEALPKNMVCGIQEGMPTPA